MSKKPNFIAIGKRTIEMEQKSIFALLHRLGKSFEQACESLMRCQGRVVVTGIGKSGHIANKIAATLSSTGTPAFFMHPAEASHGDLGMLTANDVVLTLSGSGNTNELLTLLPLIKRIGVPLIAMTGNLQSTLAQSADIHLDVSVEEEACPLGLAPTSSTTAALVMGDALAIALLEARGFSAEDFAFSHPGGTLGRRLLLKVSDVMEADFPQVKPEALLAEGLLEISQKGLGMTTITDQSHALLGIFTDGDLRRAIDRRDDLHNTNMSDLMIKNPITISDNMLAAQAMKIIEDNNISCLAVTTENNIVLGVVHLHALIKAGLA